MKLNAATMLGQAKNIQQAEIGKNKLKIIELKIIE
jgi:hypothetical protein